jgi:hypothetical protein
MRGLMPTVSTVLGRTMLTVTLLGLVGACASRRTRRPVRPAPPAQVAAGCRTVLDCMLAQGSPPGGTRWTCQLGACATEVFAQADPGK